MRILKRLGLGCVLMASFGAHAEEVLTTEQSPSAWGSTTGNVSLTTDYITRGISQTNHQPALQGGLDWGNSQDFYLGA